MSASGSSNSGQVVSSGNRPILAGFPKGKERLKGLPEAPSLSQGCSRKSKRISGTSQGACAPALVFSILFINVADSCLLGCNG